MSHISKIVMCFTGYYRTAIGTTVTLADGNEMTDGEFNVLAAGTSPDRSSCSDCDCSTLNADGKLEWTQCNTNSHKYVCQYEGTFVLWYYCLS